MSRADAVNTITPAPAGSMSARTHQMLHAPLVATLFRLAMPNIIGLLAMTLIIGYDGFILKPQEPEVIDALRKIRLDDDVSRNHGTRDISIVGAIVAVRLRLRDRTDSGYIRSAGYRVRAENVVDGAKCVFGAHEIRKRSVQEIHSDRHIHHGARSAPGAETGGHAERGGVQSRVHTRHVRFYRSPHLSFRARVQIR